MKKLILSLVLGLLVSLPAHAINQEDSKDFENLANDNFSAGVAGRYRLGTSVTREKVWVMRASYDFAQNTGAISVIKLRNNLVNSIKGVYLPKKAVVVGCYIDVITAPTSGGSATIAIGTGQAANDLLTATAYSSFSGIMACTPTGTAASAIKLTSDVQPTMSIAVATLTAGKFNVLIEYILSD